MCFKDHAVGFKAQRNENFGNKKEKEGKKVPDTIDPAQGVCVE